MSLKRWIGVVGALALAGCLTSDGPLFDAENARALAFADGDYEACQVDDGVVGDCNDVNITHDASGLYTFVMAIEDEKPSFARFKAVGADKWAAQLWGMDDDDPFYFLASRASDETSLSMIDCEGLPESFKKKYVARGKLEVREETTCVAKSASAVVAATKAWAKTDAARTGDRVAYKKKAAG